MHHGASFLASSHWQQPGGEAWRGLSPVTSPLLQLHLPPWSAVPASSGQSWPHTFLRCQVPTKQQQSSESQALCKKQKATKPWVWTVGSHILACSLLSAPGPSCPSPGGTESQCPSQGRQPDTKSPGKRLQQKYTQHLCLLLSTCTVAQGTCPGVGQPGVRNQHPISVLTRTRRYYTQL